MPEMADVEVLKRRFNEEMKGATITGLKILNPALVKVSDLEKRLTGEKILEAQRYGKYLFIKINANGWLIIHFGLTGHLIFEKELPQKFSSEAMLVISTDLFHLIYEAGRIFGMVGWCNAPQDFIQEKKMGPDAGAISKAEFLKRMRGLKGAVKPALMDQHKIAGVGNVYADEILFQAEIHPQESIKNLTEEQLKTIYDQLHRVHDAAVKVDAVRTRMPEWAMMKIRKTSRICPKCGKKLEMTLLNNRETLTCPQCQKKHQAGLELNLGRL